jgi:Uma2 family endonuclease
MIVHGVRWKDYVILREALDTPGLRMTYCEGVLELMYAFLRELPLLGYGSTTFRNEAKERGVEPDECWRVGSQMKDGELPDIVLEVIYASPILDKLHVYDGLEIPEVWLWRDGGFELYERRVSGGYARVENSSRLPAIDFTIVARFVTREDQDVALREFAQTIRETP